MKYNVGAQRTRGHSTTGDKSSSLQNSDASRLNTPTGDPHDAASAAYKTCVCAWLRRGTSLHLRQKQALCRTRF